MTDPALDLLYVHGTNIGYGRLGVKLADALQRAGIKVVDHLDPGDRDPLNVVCWISTPQHNVGWFNGQRTVMLTMWESMSIPESFREGLHVIDQIIVPSDQNVELFSRYHPNVVKVPLGIDTHEWKYRKRKPPATDFRFLIGGSGLRKGQDVAYEAFRKVFKTWPSDMPRPVLQFKSPKPCEFRGERIEVIGGHISDEAERDLYGAAHCYLQPSRGEGWGLQPLQAIAQGLPTILTDAHGQAEFAHLGHPIGWQEKEAAYFLYGDAGSWWEPNLDELCERMEWVYYHYDEACEQARASSAVAHREFSWERCAEKFVDAVGMDQLTAEYSGDHTWVKPEYKRYLVRVLKPWKAEIAGAEYQFTPGKDYWEVANIKRVLYEAEQILDPSCVVRNPSGKLTELETGLTEEQLSRFGDYSAKAEFCWTCHQRLGSGELYQPPEAV